MDPLLEAQVALSRVQVISPNFRKSKATGAERQNSGSRYQISKRDIATAGGKKRYMFGTHILLVEWSIE